MKSFLGYLEGTHKANHTVKSYRSDLKAFENYLAKKRHGKPIQIGDVTRKSLLEYAEFLQAEGLRTNTRRRKLLTVRRWFRFLTQRKKMDLDVADRLPAPQKMERIPRTISYEVLDREIEKLTTDTLIARRNRLLLRTLLETGCLVSEVTRLRSSQFTTLGVEFIGKAPRTIRVSESLIRDAQVLAQELASDPSSDPHLFEGFNKFGSMGAPMTPRGVELLVKHWAKQIHQRHLTPRLIRHSTVLRWAALGATDADLLSWLGLKTNYALRTYAPLLKRVRSEISVPEERTSL